VYSNCTIVVHIEEMNKGKERGGRRGGRRRRRNRNWKKASKDPASSLFFLS